jgi:hypothetical protein
MLIVTLVAFGSGVWAGNELSSKQARRLIARLGGMALAPDQVHIRRVDMGFGSRDAVVEALVQTGFKFTRENNEWTVTHVRTGDRQWESVELVTTAVAAEKVKRTKADLDQVAQAVVAYHRDYEAYPPAAEFSELIDMLLPRYLNRIIREDYWHQSYVYALTPRGFQLLSFGPDGKRGTSDDIVIESGASARPATE